MHPNTYTTRPPRVLHRLSTPGSKHSASIPPVNVLQGVQQSRWREMHVNHVQASQVVTCGMSSHGDAMQRDEPRSVMTHCFVCRAGMPTMLEGHIQTQTTQAPLGYLYLLRSTKGLNLLHHVFTRAPTTTIGANGNLLRKFRTGIPLPGLPQRPISAKAHFDGRQLQHPHGSRKK